MAVNCLLYLFLVSGGTGSIAWPSLSNHEQSLYTKNRDLMGVYARPPFALCSLVKLSLETIDYILDSARDGTGVNMWWLYLIGENETPGNKPSAGGGTEAPIRDNFRSRFLGWSFKQLASWVEQHLKETGLEDKFFVVLDERAKQDQSVAICKIGIKGGKDDEVKCVLMSAKESAGSLGAMQYGDFEELLWSRGEYHVKTESDAVNLVS